MKVCVWITEHEIARQVGLTIAKSLDADAFFTHHRIIEDYDGINKYDLHIGYGILRGMDKVFKACQAAGKPFIHIDKGYWKPNHFDGYYRVSLNGTQQTFGFDKLDPDYARWDALGIEILPIRKFDENDMRPVLYCPPTHEVSMFTREWMDIPAASCGHKLIVRRKNMGLPLQPDLDECSMVYTFNSSVGWEALRQGIAVASDPTHSIIGAYVKHFTDKGDNSFASGFYKDVNKRRELFALMAGLQLTLEEIKSGLLWPLIQKLISTLDGTDAKPLHQTLQPTPSEAGRAPI